MSRSRRTTPSRRRRSPSPDVLSSGSRRSGRSRSRAATARRSSSEAETAVAPSRPSRSIDLVIDAEGHGTFHIATKGLGGKINASGNNNNSSSSPFIPGKSKKSPAIPSHLTFDIQIDESSQRYLIHTSMGRLDKIRTIHPGMNILRTLSYWNGLQKRRYGTGPADVKGGQLGIVSKNRRNVVMMTLMGEYVHRAWEYDDVFQRELERFVEDALQFHLCLNGDGGGGAKGGEVANGGAESDAEGEKGGGGPFGGLRPRSRSRTRRIHHHIFNSSGNGGGGDGTTSAKSPAGSSVGTPGSYGGPSPDGRQSNTTATNIKGAGEDPLPATTTAVAAPKRRTPKLFDKVLPKSFRD